MIKNSMMYIAKYIAYCGVCSRRKAIEFVKDGRVAVNGKTVTDVTYVVKEGDRVTYNGNFVCLQSFKYIVLNKPKDYITTVSDEKNRKTVMDLISAKTLGRLYPVGRLDRMTTGVLLLTNDGGFAQKLSHPKYEISKIYHVTLNKSFKRNDFEKLLQGVSLEDGVASVDNLAYMENKTKSDLIIELHSGKNRIVRRIFEHLGYDVKKLDRISFAGITKKGLMRGESRFLTDREVEALSPKRG